MDVEKGRSVSNHKRRSVSFTKDCVLSGLIYDKMPDFPDLWNLIRNYRITEKGFGNEITLN